MSNFTISGKNEPDEAWRSSMTLLRVHLPSERRQPYLDEESYTNTLAHFEKDRVAYAEFLTKASASTRAKVNSLESIANDIWAIFLLNFTAGVSPEDLSRSLEQVVLAFEDYAKQALELPDEEYAPAFELDEMLDIYVDYLQLLSAAILLHREDLVPRIFGLIEGTHYDGVDALIEGLLQFYLPDRPVPDEWLWDKPFDKLIKAIDSPVPKDREKAMAKYVASWYTGMKGRANFWGKHEQITPEFTPYFGYWAMCAAAFTYLYDIDDNLYRNEIVYPKDLVDFARNQPRKPVKLKNGSEILRVLGGQLCPADGQWFSPAKAESARQFKKGDAMPTFDSAYGLTIWQLSKLD